MGKRNGIRTRFEQGTSIRWPNGGQCENCHHEAIGRHGTAQNAGNAIQAADEQRLVVAIAIVLPVSQDPLLHSWWYSVAERASSRQLIVGHVVRRQTVINHFGAESRFAFLGGEKGQQWQRLLIGKQELPALGVATGSKGPDHLLQIGGVDVVIQQDDLGHKGAGTRMMQDLGQFADEPFGRVLASIGIRHGDYQPMSRAVKRAEAGGHWETG